MQRALFPIVLAAAMVMSPAAWSHEQEEAPDEERQFLRGYRSNYILYGPSGSGESDCDIKFQLSLKQRLWPDRDSRERWYQRFHFGYTQKSWWDICADSAPFRESQFNPELFWVKDFGNRDGESVSQLKLGIEHNSNGDDGDDSRSWDRLYGQMAVTFGPVLQKSLFAGREDDCQGCDWSRPLFTARLKTWYIVNTGDENKDIEDYMGHVEYGLLASTPGEQLGLSGWVGDEGKVTVQADLILKAIPLLNKIPFVGPVLPSPDNSYSWHVQYFNGYGDELIEYDDRDHVVRFGVLLYLEDFRESLR